MIGYFFFCFLVHIKQSVTNSNVINSYLLNDLIVQLGMFSNLETKTEIIFGLEVLRQT